MKVRRVDWYPVDWLDGVAAMPPDERGVYDTIINLIYAHGEEDGSLEMEERELAIRCGCHWRHLRRLLVSLAKRGKVSIVGRKISHKRCAEELQKSRKRLAQAEQNLRTNGAGSPHNEPQSAKLNGIRRPDHARPRATHQTSTIKHQPSTRVRTREESDSKNGFEKVKQPPLDHVPGHFDGCRCPGCERLGQLAADYHAQTQPNPAPSVEGAEQPKATPDRP